MKTGAWSKHRNNWDLRAAFKQFIIQILNEDPRSDSGRGFKGVLEGHFQCLGRQDCGLGKLVDMY